MQGQPVQYIPVPMPQQQPRQPSLMEEETLVKPEKEELTRWQLETLDVLGDMEHYLRGDVFLNGSWIKPEKPLMNEQGVRFFISSMSKTVSKLTALTSLGENQVNANLREIMMDFSDVLIEKHKDFEIDRAYLEVILNDLTRFCELAMTRSQDGLTLKNLGERVRTVEKVGYDMGNKDEQKSGWLPSIFKRK